ncbi:MAG: Bifunctional protein pyrR [Owenweeksia sp. TMED14]|nr:MAG: Bifunctional protein pyrR [Owenweeksia sp. TMED14]|tara:strand:- start:950 stop:1504 length:555 start_codon:yes stop_codon:yes gene_type:complete
MLPKIFLNSRESNITLNRICCQLNEKHYPWNNSVIVGLQPRGVELANVILKRLKNDFLINDIPFGLLDSTFHRDDFRRRKQPIIAKPNKMPILIEGKRLILVDDVLYTGRSVRAALDALGDYGRPLKIELCVLIDRRFSRELPIQPDYSGHRVDAIADERVTLDWSDNDSPEVLIENPPHASEL